MPMKRRSLIAATTAAATATTAAATAQPRPRIIALEEHFVTPALGATWARLPEAEREVSQTTISAWVAARLGEIGEERLRRMDETGVDVQVLSPTAPGVQSLPAAEAVPLARDTNDRQHGCPERPPHSGSCGGGRSSDFYQLVAYWGVPQQGAQARRRATSRMGRYRASETMA